jgi:hypothetical protein
MAKPAGPAVAFIAEREQQWAQDSSSTTHQPEIDDWWEAFGDLLGGKEEGTLRAGVQNFDGMTSKPNQPEDESLRRWITEQQFDIYGIPETDLYWSRVRANLQLHE